MSSASICVRTRMADGRHRVTRLEQQMGKHGTARELIRNEICTVDSTEYADAVVRIGNKTKCYGVASAVKARIKVHVTDMDDVAENPRLAMVY